MRATSPPAHYVQLHRFLSGNNSRSASMVASGKHSKPSHKNANDKLAGGRSSGQSCIYEFGAFRLDEKERLLFRGESQVALTPKVFDLLLLLVQRSNSLVDKETILSELWPDAFVEEANLSVNVATSVSYTHLTLPTICSV